MANDNKERTFTTKGFNGSYRYIGGFLDNNNYVEYEYNPDIYELYKNNRDYDGLINYVNRYQFFDQRDIDWQQSVIDNATHKKQEEEYLYHNAPDDWKPYLDFLREFDNYNSNPNDYNLRNSDNPVSKEYINKVDAIFGDSDNIQIQFPAAKQKLFGLDIFDFVIKDTENNFDNFLKDTGFSREYLEQNGIEVKRTSDGSASINVNESNPLLHDILMNIEKYSGKLQEVYRVNEDGSLDQVSDYSLNNNVRRNTKLYGLYLASEGLVTHNPIHMAEGVAAYMSPRISNLIKEYQDFYNDAKDKENSIYEQGGINNRVFDAVFMPLEFPNSETLEDRMDLGGTDAAGAKNTYTLTKDKIFAAIKNLNGTESYKVRVFGDKKYEGENGRPERYLTDVEKREFFENLIIDDKDVTFGYNFYGDGSVSMKINIDGKEATSKTKEVLPRSFEIFGFLTDDAEKTLKSSDKYYSDVEANRLAAYCADYKDIKGNEYKCVAGRNNEVLFNDDKGNIYTKKDLVPIIHKDRLIKGYGRQLVRDYVNNNGEFIPYPNSINDIIGSAFLIYNEVYDNVDRPTIDGKPVTDQQAIQILGLTSEERSKMLNQNTAKYFDEILDIMFDLRNYMSKYVTNKYNK